MDIVSIEYSETKIRLAYFDINKTSKCALIGRDNLLVPEDI